jgi:hypothetical protein
VQRVAPTGDAGTAADVAAGPGVAVDVAGVPGTGGRDATSVPGSAAPPGSAAVIDRPQSGQATHPGSSAARQSGQRPCVNGSVTPQNGQATTLLSMNFVQNGHGCL